MITMKKKKKEKFDFYIQSKNTKHKMIKIRHSCNSFTVDTLDSVP